MVRQPKLVGQPKERRSNLGQPSRNTIGLDNLVQVGVGQHFTRQDQIDKLIDRQVGQPRQTRYRQNKTDIKNNDNLEDRN